MASLDLQSKITRAMKAVLKNAGVTGTIIAAPENIERTLPLTTITCDDGRQTLDQPGNWNFPDIQIFLKDDAVADPGIPDYAERRTAANSHFSSVCSALCLSDDGGQSYDYMARLLTAAGQALATTGTAEQQADNADMAAFTVLFWNPTVSGSGKISTSDKGTFWERVVGFECIACNVALNNG
jgi:hypothetical protein